MKDVKILRFDIKDSTSPDEISFVHVGNAVRKQINGNLYLQVLKPTTLKQITIKLQGECLTTLKEVAPEMVFMREQLLSVKCQLINVQESILDAPKEFGVGEHCVPFAIGIRQDLPSTQENQMTNRAVSISYRLVAALEAQHSALATLVRNASFSKPAGDAHLSIKLKQFTFRSTTDMFPIKQINYKGKRDGKIEYGIVVPEKILLPLERLHIRGSVLPLHTESVVDHMVVKLCQQKAISLVSKDPLRPSTYNMMQADAEVNVVVLAERHFKYEPKQGAEQIDLDFDVYFKKEDVVATFDSPMFEVRYFVKVTIEFASEQKRLALKFPTAMATVMESYDFPASPPIDQPLPEYTVIEEAPSYDGISSSSP
ncbi:hypothetical protein BC943DRAFT_315326 [Umbelopsis sp. AD052]|nr:hypothetical protein BC943DRAFT_315326 [Umbelopsis sp. AD052]